MLIDFNNLKKKLYDYEFSEYDILVIGAGPAGIVLCDYIKKNNNSIKLLLIEKGGYSNFSYSRIYSSFLKIKNDSRVFGVGGTSNVWSGISSVFTKSELTDYNSKNSKWPLTYSDL
jgi:choline dehydrogenase-like flavoprotein